MGKLSIGIIAVQVRRNSGCLLRNILHDINTSGIDTSKSFTEGQRKRAIDGLNRMFFEQDLKSDDPARRKLAMEVSEAITKIFKAIETQRPLRTGKPERKRSRPRRS